MAVFTILLDCLKRIVIQPPW